MCARTTGGACPPKRASGLLGPDKRNDVEVAQNWGALPPKVAENWGGHEVDFFGRSISCVSVCVQYAPKNDESW